MTLKIPTTMEAAIEMIELDVPETARRQIADGEFSSPAMLHHGLGTAIRNEYSLWDETSPLVRHFRERFGLGHADDISGILISGVFAKIKGEPFDPAAQVERSKAHWAALGVDGLDQRPIEARVNPPSKTPRDWWAWLGLRKA